MSVEARFNKAVWLIRNGPPQADSSNEDKLNFYKFYKQVKTWWSSSWTQQIAFILLVFVVALSLFFFLFCSCLYARRLRQETLPAHNREAIFLSHVISCSSFLFLILLPLDALIFNDHLSHPSLKLGCSAWGSCQVGCAQLDQGFAFSSHVCVCVLSSRSIYKPSFPWSQSLCVSLSPGMSREEAMEKYIALLGADWESNPALAGYKA